MATKRQAVSAITFVDLETTGLDFRRHEILEIGVIRADAKTLEVVAQCDVRVSPERLDLASPEALAIAGFSLAEWEEASTLEVALARVAPLFEGALVAGHNVGFDWAFLEEAFRNEELPLPEVDYHRLPTPPASPWPLVATGELRSLSLDSVAGYLAARARVPTALWLMRAARWRSHGGSRTACAKTSPVGRLRRASTSAIRSATGPPRTSGAFSASAARSSPRASCPSHRTSTCRSWLTRPRSASAR